LYYLENKHRLGNLVPSPSVRRPYLTYVLAGLVGLSLGLLGSGGSVLAVPILKYSAGFSAREAVATSLATVGAVSLVGALLAWKEGRVVWRVALLFSLFATLGTFGGVALATRMPERLQMLAFVLVMAYAVYRMVGSEAGSGSDSSAASGSGSKGAAVIKALAVGVLTGVVGVGGGFLIVPALVALFGLSMKKATGTSLVVIAINSAVATASYSQSVTLNWTFTLAFVAAALLGLFVGFRLSDKIDEKRLKSLFAAMLALVCIYTAVREFLL
jgi:uncharacterized protein